MHGDEEPRGGGGGTLLKTTGCIGTDIGLGRAVRKITAASLRIYQKAQVKRKDAGRPIAEFVSLALRGMSWKGLTFMQAKAERHCTVGPPGRHKPNAASRQPSAITFLGHKDSFIPRLELLLI